MALRIESFESLPPVEDYLIGIDFPATRNELIRSAEDSGAPDDIVSILYNLPDEEYESAADVLVELGEFE